MSGFIPVKRSLFEHFLFKEHRTFSRFEAWLDLIQMASFTDQNRDIIAGRIISKNRGEIVASLRYLANKWNWSLGKVCDYIELLRSQNMVVATKENGITKIRLVNFDKHNKIQEKDSKRNSETQYGTAFDHNQHTAIDTTGEQSANSQHTNSNKDNKGNNVFGESAKPTSPQAKKLEEKQKDMLTRREQFYKSLIPFLNQYGKEMIRAFYDHWSEPNKSKTKFKQEMQNTWDLERRLRKWESNQYKFGSLNGAKATKTEPPTPTLKTIS